MKFAPAPDVQARLCEIVEKLRPQFTHIKEESMVCMRSFGARTSARARIWSLPRIWQSALGTAAHYVIEVPAQNFDPLPKEEKDKILIHELMHVPKTFSGGLRPHRCFGKRIDKRAVERYYKMLR